MNNLYKSLHKKIWTLWALRPPIAQRQSGHRILYFALSRFKNDSKRRFLGALDATYQKLSLLYARRTNVLASGQVHILGWLIGIAEVWITLRFMGFPVSVNEAIVIESLVQAVRGAAFAIPGPPRGWPDPVMRHV